MTVGSSGTSQVYIDNHVAPGNSGINPVAVNFYVGKTAYGASGSPIYFSGNVSHVIVYNGVLLTATQVANHYHAGFDAFTGDDTGTHLARLLDYKSFPTSLRAINTGSSIVGSYDLSGGSVMEFVTDMAQTELGQTYFDGAGKFTHRSRGALVTDTRSQTSQATWGDGTAGTSVLYDNDGFEQVRDETLIRNPVRAARRGGVTAIASDSAFSDVYGERDWSAPDALDSEDNVMTDRAQYLLNRFKDLATRFPSIRFTPRRAPASLWPQVLGTEIGDRVTVTWLSPRSASRTMLRLRLTICRTR